jgi:hypothetical protein
MLFLSTRVCLRCRIFFLAQLYQACWSLFQNNPFRGMLPRRPAIKRDDPADEDRMATRLELMGKRGLLSPFLRHGFYVIVDFWSAEQVNNARKSKDNQDKPVKVDVFRGVSFDNWLRLFMQVEFDHFTLDCRDYSLWFYSMHSNLPSAGSMNWQTKYFDISASPMGTRAMKLKTS